MKYIAIVLCLFLVGCSTAPVKHTLSSLPEELSTQCSTLNPIPESEEKLSELLKVVNRNYGLYYECMIRHESLVEWYNKQKKIHDDVHK